MDINANIEQLRAAQIAHDNAQKAITSRLITNAEALRNLLAKKHYTKDFDLWSWIYMIDNPGIAITVNESSNEFPFIVTLGNKSWKIAQIFVTGSTRDVVKAARQWITFDRYQEDQKNIRSLRLRLDAEERDQELARKRFLQRQERELNKFDQDFLRKKAESERSIRASERRCKKAEQWTERQEARAAKRLEANN